MANEPNDRVTTPYVCARCRSEQTVWINSCPHAPATHGPGLSDDKWIRKQAATEDGCFVGAGSPSVAPQAQPVEQGEQPIMCKCGHHPDGHCGEGGACTARKQRNKEHPNDWLSCVCKYYVPCKPSTTAPTETE